MRHCLSRAPGFLTILLLTSGSYPVTAVTAGIAPLDEISIDYQHDRIGRSSDGRQLSDEEKARFAGLFRSTYRRQLADLLAVPGEQAYSLGHGDGWSYGTLVAREWGRRKGYHEGFTSALREHARVAFRGAVPEIEARSDGVAR